VPALTAYPRLESRRQHAKEVRGVSFWALRWVWPSYQSYAHKHGRAAPTLTKHLHAASSIGGLWPCLVSPHIPDWSPP